MVYLNNRGSFRPSEYLAVQHERLLPVGSSAYPGKWALVGWHTKTIFADGMLTVTEPYRLQSRILKLWQKTA